MFLQVFGCLRLDGKKMPLKFFYPKWVNGERVSGTLDGAGYYKLLRLDLNIFSFKHYYIWFKNVDTTASLKSGIRTMVHLLTRVGNRLVIIKIFNLLVFKKKSNISASCILICKLSLTWSWHSSASACLKCIYIFPKDGASPHRTNKVLNYLQSSFGTRTLALGAEGWGAKEWCPNSPDLAPMDFCIWGVMKVIYNILSNNAFIDIFQHHVFSHPMPQNRNELVDKINQVWDNNITEDLIQKAAKGFLNRCQKVLAANGRHQNNEWFRTLSESEFSRTVKWIRPV